MSIVHKKYKVYIKNKNHPHYGETCNPVGDNETSVTLMNGMYLLKSCQSGIEFYAERDDMDLIDIDKENE